MRRFVIAVAALALGLWPAWPARGQVIVPANAGFTTPALSNGTHVQRPTGASWTFFSTSGVAHNDPGHVDLGVTSSPTGQAGYVQGTGIFLQSVSGFATSDYKLTFQAEGSSILGTNHIQVAVDSTTLTFGGSSSVTPSSTSSFTTVTSDIIHLTAGSHFLTFAGLDSSTSHASFVVNPVFNPVRTPEPSSFALCSLLVSGGGFIYYRKRRAKRAAERAAAADRAVTSVA